MSTIQNQLVERLVDLERQVADLKSREQPLTRIKAQATSDLGQLIPTGVETIIDFYLIELDTTDAIATGAVWKFTAPVAGTYLINASVFYEPDSSVEDCDFTLWLYLNGFARAGLHVIRTITNQTQVLQQGSVLLYLNAGDYIDLRTWHNMATDWYLLSSDLYTRVAIMLIP